MVLTLRRNELKVGKLEIASFYINENIPRILIGALVSDGVSDGRNNLELCHTYGVLRSSLVSVS